jgi:hypothetical protein
VLADCGWKTIYRCSQQALEQLAIGVFKYGVNLPNPTA